MKRQVGTIGLLLGMGILTCGATGVLAQGPPPPPPPGYYDQPWAQPPGEYQEISRKGFHDGIEGARKDFGNHRPPNVENRDEYRHPDVPREARHDYREAFRRGYQVGVQHMYNGGPRRDDDDRH